MIPPLHLHLPPVIEFGADAFEKLNDHAQGARRVFVLCDVPLLAYARRFADVAGKSGQVTLISSQVIPEPPIEALETVLAAARDFNPDAVLGIGGGSAMDMAKLIAVLVGGNQAVRDIIGIDKVKERKVRLMAAAATAGTGSEVTPIAVLTSTAEKLKKGVVSRHLVPDVAVIDPLLTRSVPPAITAATGVDALTHCIEAYTNKNAHPVVDDWAISGMRLILANLEPAVADGNNMAARTAMALGSLYGGLCLGPVNTAAVHAMAYPLGGEYKVPHGVANSVLLPFVMRFNTPACVEKYLRVAAIAGVAPGQSAEAMIQQGIRRIRDLSVRCGIPANLQKLGVPESALAPMAKACLSVKRLMDNNPRAIAYADALAIYQWAYQGLV